MDQGKLYEFINSVLVSSSQMAYIEEANGTLQLLENLSEVFRYLTVGKDSVTLYNELDILERYFRIQKVRYGDRINIVLENNGSYKSIYLRRLVLFDFFEEILSEYLESNEKRADFIFEIDSGSPSVTVRVSVSGREEDTFHSMDL